MAYLIGWLCAGLAISGVMVGLGHQLAYSMEFGGLAAFFWGLLFLPVYYPCRALRPERTDLAMLLPSLAALAFIFGSIWATAMLLATRAIALWGDAEFLTPKFVDLALMGFVACALCEAVYYIYIAHVKSREAERTGQELRVMAREAELRALRAQLNPHFLFNSLNSISALTTADPAKAREMCVLLADFLRKGLRLGEKQSVALSEELDLLKNYFAIEQIRFAPRLTVEWNISDACLCAEIPTLLLQPLAENAIKHGIAQTIEGGTVRLRAEAKGELAMIELENPADDFAAVASTKGLGLGLRQVQQRLATFFGEEALLQASRGGGTFKVRLNFPLVLKGANNE
ncbi:MAG: histidine kinase [Holophagales bacterium]|nr:histidine kinase [Holophagales bacterium]